MKTILIIDDEPMILDLISLFLEPMGFNCIKKESAIDGIIYLQTNTNKVDLILLDIMMPEMDGLTACRDIKSFWDIPIIMITAKDEQPDIVKGLRIGADDYISKPFNEEELVARIEAVLRRFHPKEDIIIFNGLILKLNSFELTYLEKEVLLTPKESALLALFLNNPKKVLSRNQLKRSISSYGNDIEIEDRTIDSYIKNLRGKLKSINFPQENHLKTVWRMGYKWTKENN
ncbi:DNA-binding response regulator [Cytobacillus horneckiae]|uniref:DNA-binding response regulator n=1 Tax=Cytobacillus horneckiae TaxID=549687 RepID=A0A2N0ZAK3_9BACI|nr:MULTISPECIES: response regulator transcription factor [Cytobacillus]MCA1028861.1 response regulator transcription factor [Cytobacillus kochii]MEC1157745.1 response regulator transcription factor [Cytobacillus horneckiae]NRG48192.1 response regulator transcription factor [Bacillus sp. CRN 9]PKG26548.1 DNA-binding response regulator [Cytobacillus horneckiae]